MTLLAYAAIFVLLVAFYAGVPRPPKPPAPPPHQRYMGPT